MQGYNKGMQAIFKKAGYIQEFASEESQLKEETPHKAGDSETGKRFSSLDTCIEVSFKLLYSKTVGRTISYRHD